jgi:hypothetical protein
MDHKQQNKNVIEAQDFILKDSDGNISARLGIAPGEGPFLVLFDGGQPRMILAIDHDGPMMWLSNQQGKPVTQLDCLRGQANLRIRSDQNSSMIEAKVTEAGPEVTLSDPNGKYMVEVRASTAGLQVSTVSEPEGASKFDVPSLSKFIQ